MGEPEVIWAVRRADGELIGDEYAFHLAGPNDWSAAEDDSESWHDDFTEHATEYELVRMTVEVVERRAYWNGKPVDDENGPTADSGRTDEPHPYIEAMMRLVRPLAEGVPKS